MENETNMVQEGERAELYDTSSTSNQFILSLVLFSFHLPGTDSNQSNCMCTNWRTNQQLDGWGTHSNKRGEERRVGTTEKGCGKGRCGEVIPMSSVVTIFETLGSIRERVCNDFSPTEPDPCAQQSFQRHFPGIRLQKLEQYENSQFTFMISHLLLETPDNC